MYSNKPMTLIKNYDYINKCNYQILTIPSQLKDIYFRYMYFHKHQQY